MTTRYTREKMGAVWSEARKFLNWVRVEVVVLRAKVALGELTVRVPENLEESISIIVEEINRLEREKTKHDVVAFLELTSSQLPAELRPYWHHRMTSYDVVDTALSLQLVESVSLLQETLVQFMEALKARALQYKYTAQIGRTHLVHAEPITFGAKLANWHAECQRQAKRLAALRNTVAVGKLSGAVGMFTIDPKVELQTCNMLGLTPIIATQIISRDIIAEYLCILANVGGTMKKIADNIRQLQSTEIREVQEYFSPDQKGSSAMPHKRNPISSESVSGLVGVLRGYAAGGLALQDDLHERVLCNSAPERVLLPDSSILLDFIIGRMTKVIQQLIVYPERMKINLELTRGLIFSQDVQALVASKSGLARERAYDLVREVAQRCWDSGADFLQALLGTPEIMEHVTEAELRGCFDLPEKLLYVDHIFERVFGEN